MVAPAMAATAFCRSSGANRTGSTESARGKIAAAPMPSTARAAMSCADRSRVGAGGGAGAEEDQGDKQQPLAAEAVAEQAGREDQRREHQAVGVGDPLQVAR